jgi:hypothetical protein
MKFPKYDKKTDNSLQFFTQSIEKVIKKPNDQDVINLNISKNCKFFGHQHQSFLTTELNVLPFCHAI